MLISHSPARAFEGVSGEERALQQLVALHDSGAVNGRSLLRGRATGGCGRGRRAVADFARVG